jgi:hypothetical protein
MATGGGTRRKGDLWRFTKTMQMGASILLARHLQELRTQAVKAAMIIYKIA